MSYERDGGYEPRRIDHNMVAKLDSGEKVPYDASANPDEENPYPNLHKIGEGVIFSIDGQEEIFVRRYAFFVKR